jgi:hypothetical protein
MPGYQLLSVVAASLQTDSDTLLDFSRKGWIRTTTRNAGIYLAADQRYRAKYILYLRGTKHLNDDQTQLVLSVQPPPYAASQVDEILKQHAVS